MTCLLEDLFVMLAGINALYQLDNEPWTVGPGDDAP